MPDCLAAIVRFRFQMATSALKSEPSWNLTPFLKASVADKPSADGVTDVARRGTSVPSVCIETSASTAGEASVPESGANSAG